MLAFPTGRFVFETEMADEKGLNTTRSSLGLIRLAMVYCEIIWAGQSKLLLQRLTNPMEFFFIFIH